MNNEFVKQFENNIKFNYTCFDRVIIKGYILKFFSIGVIVNFLKSMGFSKRHNGVLRIFTDQLNDHIQKEAKKDNIPIKWWPAIGGKNGAKLKYVEKYFNKRYKPLKKSTDHVFCIITDKEPVQTISSKEVRSIKGRLYNKFYKVRKPVKQYYIYFHDSVLGGPCYLKISSYLPFHCELYFNGHNFIKQKLDEIGVKYRMKENAFVDVSEPEIIENIAKELDGRLINDRINYWMDRFFKFDKGKYSTRSKYLQHDWYVSQAEICSNVVFKSSKFFTSLFERILDKFSRIGLPDSISKIFSKRPRRSESKTFVRLYDNNACLKHWFRRNSIKQYNKQGYLFRTETTINNPKSLGLKKSVLYLQSYLWFGLACNEKLLDCCANVDISTIADEKVEIFNKPVLDQRFRKISAPDLRKDRQYHLYDELLKAKYKSFGFKTSDLAKSMKEHFQNPGQIRYELKKLIVRGVVKKKKNKSFYEVTGFGWKYLFLSISSKRYFENPMISKSLKNDIQKSCVQPSKFEEAYRNINDGLNTITQQLALSK